MSWLPTLKWLSCDTLTHLRNPTKELQICHCLASAYLSVIHLPTQSTHFSTSTISEWKSDGVEGWWSWISSANLWWPHLCRTMTLQSKEYCTQDWTLRNPVVKLLLWRGPTIATYSLDSVRQLRRSYTEHDMQPGEENAMIQRIERSLQIKFGQNGHLAFINITKKAVRHIYESCLCTVVRTVSRLNVITDSVLVN